MEENSNGCTARVQESDSGTARVQESDSGPDDAVSKCFGSHVIISSSI